MSIVQLNTPKWRPIPPAVSDFNTISKRQLAENTVKRDLPSSNVSPPGLIFESKSCPPMTLSAELPKSFSFPVCATLGGSLEIPASEERRKANIPQS